MAATHKLIETYRLSSAQSTITFSSIPQTYTDLKVYVSARSTLTGSVRRYIDCNINGLSTTQTYIRSIAYSTGSTVTDYDPVTSNWSVQTAADAAANTFSQGEYYFSNYTNTTDHKAANFTGGALGDSNNEHMIGIWGAIRTSNSAITSISFVSGDAGNFAANTVFSLYGIKNS